MSKIEHDDITGTATTGHEWDGIKELNTPLPRWWLYTFYATIAWAAVYTVLYPAWPLLNGATPGILGYSSPRRREREHRAGEGRAGRAAPEDRLGLGRGHPERPCPARIRTRRRCGCVQGQLRPVPRLGRGRRRRLSEPQRRRLALGRHARPDPHHAAQRHPLYAEWRDARLADAGLRRRWHPDARTDRRRGELHADARRADRRTRQRPSAASSSSSTTAPPATARTARA